MDRSRRIWVVLFDAFDTLARPRQPPHIQYARAARAHGLRWSGDGIDAQDEAVRAAFKAAFRQTAAEHPRYGRDSGLPDPAAWWTLLITRTFAALPGLHPPAPPTPALAHDLLSRFASASAYTLFDDVQPALAALHARAVPVALATNSDAAILHALRDLGLGAYINLSLGTPASSTQHGPPPTLSYFVGAEKPAPAFFHAALRAAGLDPDTDAHHALYVGDQLHEDYWAARDVGMCALWLRRPGTVSNQAVRVGPRLGTEAERGSDAVEPGAAVASLQEVVDYVERVEQEAQS